MLNKLKNVFNQINNEGTNTILNVLNKEKEEIDNILYLLNVIDFCSVLEILLKFSIDDSEYKYIELNFNKKTKNNITFKLYDANKNLIPNKIAKVKFKKFYFGVSQMLEKFNSFKISFLEDIFNKKEKILPLTTNGIEEIKEFMFSKEMYIAYQYNKLNETLENKDNISIHVVKI